MNNTLNYKISVLGQTLVGKSALTYRFICNKFPTEHDTTIEDQYKATLEIDGYHVSLEILDTAGQDDYQSMIDTWIDFAEGFLLVYSIDDKESFESLKDRYSRIVNNKQNKIYSIIIVGNKCDLEDKRQVSKKEAEDYAKSINSPFMEVSALKSINVKECFIKLVHDLIIKNERPQEAVKDGCCLIY